MAASFEVVLMASSNRNTVDYEEWQRRGELREGENGMLSRRAINCKHRCEALLLLVLFVSGCHRSVSNLERGLQFIEITTPAQSGSSVPTISVGGDKRFYMVWVEPAGDKVNRLKFSRWNAMQWSPARVIAEGTAVLASASGEPKLLALDERNLAATWMSTTQGAKDPDATSLEISFSKDGGATWSTPVQTSDDKTEGEHEYASLFPMNGQFGMAWLDPRRAVSTPPVKPNSNVPAATILLTTTFTKDGARGRELLLGNSVCDCCPISSVDTPGGPVLFYRNRDQDETRDIYTTRLQATKWSTGHPVHNDRWRIDGCPTNAAYGDVSGNEMVVAWFTGAEDIARVKLAFSEDYGDHFGEPLIVDEDKPVGHLSSVVLTKRTALVSWIGRSGRGRALYVQEVHADGQRTPRQTIHQYSPNASIGFPVMAQNGNDILLAWTDSDGGKIRMAHAVVPAKE